LGPRINAGISEEEFKVLLEGVRRGGNVVAARVPQSGSSRIMPIMNQSAVYLQKRSELYRKSGWQSFDPNAAPIPLTGSAANARCMRITCALVERSEFDVRQGRDRAVASFSVNGATVPDALVSGSPTNRTGADHELLRL
jgi:hypothetical protein